MFETILFKIKLFTAQVSGKGMVELKCVKLLKHDVCIISTLFNMLQQWALAGTQQEVVVGIKIL